MIKREIRRKVIHVLMGFIVLTYFYLDRATIVIICALLITATLLSKRYKKIYTLIIRPSEERKGWLAGVIYYVISIIVLTIFFDYRLASAGILSLSWGDGLATLIGRRYGKKKSKTLIGSFTMMMFTFFGCAVSLNTVPPIQGLINAPIMMTPLSILLVSLVASLFTALIELISNKVDDNLTVPLAHALIIALVSKFF